MKQNLPKSIAMLLLFPILLNCIQENRENTENRNLNSGKAIVDRLDVLFDSLENKKTTDKDFQESVVAINESIRQTLEHNIKSLEILKEIQNYFPYKAHDYSFVLSNDKKFGVFSWKTRKKAFPVKNMAFYVEGNQVLPSSLYDNPCLYDQLDVVNDSPKMPTYILGGLKSTSTVDHQYQLSAYIVRKDGIEESHIFPNGESSITIRCAEKNLGACFTIEKGKSLPKTMYTAIADQSLNSEDGEYIFN